MESLWILPDSENTLWQQAQLKQLFKGIGGIGGFSGRDTLHHVASRGKRNVSFLGHKLSPSFSGLLQGHAFLYGPQ